MKSSSCLNFPTEILRDIFELAAIDDRRTALSIALVSSWARQWTDPIIYHTVLLETPRALTNFLLAISHKPTRFVQTRIQNLGIFTMGPIQTIDRVISACSGVKSLACGFPLPWYARIGGCDTVRGPSRAAPPWVVVSGWVGYGACGVLCDPPSRSHYRKSAHI
ncbi:hypothetical protein JAAARDRAFT_35210 [Jaapia argillacea MUCL 33604]|uniref:F-box domain-containing protein n=1 Tax=Jaapia argillacea MUCL 33604 TaxID=933084 RepID=A0A067Q1Z8_9AGAM|nr:hypothetical protein JAAARDRAFT_35210 [Jaapia argillacea MUCL 33604]